MSLHVCICVRVWCRGALGHITTVVTIKSSEATGGNLQTRSQHELRIEHRKLSVIGKQIFSLFVHAAAVII